MLKPESSKHNVNSYFMKKIKIMLPMLAFLFAIASAFATQNARESAGTVYFWNNDGTCEECAQGLSMADEAVCDPQNDGEICQCQNPVQNAGINPTALDCEPVKYPKE
jgi:hypothetical protein